MRPHVPHYVNVLAQVFTTMVLENITLNLKLLASSVEDLMTKEVITAKPETEVEEVVAVMLDKHLKSMPVVDEEGVLIGSLGRRDIIKLIAKDN